MVPVWRAQPAADTDGRLDGPSERVHAVHGRQEPAADDDGLHAAHDARDVLLVPVGAVALLVPFEPLLDRADVAHTPPDGGCLIEDAAKIAVEEVREFLSPAEDAESAEMEVIFCCFSEWDKKVYEGLIYKTV